MVDTIPLWSVVVAFYAALHLLDEYAAFRGVTFQNHGQRRNWCLSRAELGPMQQAYECLRVRSGIARYDCPPADHHVRNPQIIRRKVFAWLEQVQNCVDQEKQNLAVAP